MAENIPGGLTKADIDKAVDRLLKPGTYMAVPIKAGRRLSMKGKGFLQVRWCIDGVEVDQRLFGYGPVLSALEVLFNKAIEHKDEFEVKIDVQEYKKELQNTILIPDSQEEF